MAVKRTDRLNSLLKEVISDVIREDVKNPHLSKLITITSVSITNDLSHAKVHVSVMGDEKTKQESLKALQSAAGFIAVRASKQIVIRNFPDLRFILDDSIEKQARIEELLNSIEKEREKRNPADEPQDN